MANTSSTSNGLYRMPYIPASKAGFNSVLTSYPVIRIMRSFGLISSVVFMRSKRGMSLTFASRNASCILVFFLIISSVFFPRFVERLENPVCSMSRLKIAMIVGSLSTINMGCFMIGFSIAYFFVWWGFKIHVLILFGSGWYVCTRF